VDVPEKLMLIVSEISEAMEADRVNKFCRRDLDGIPNFQSDAPFHAFEGLFKSEVKDTFEDELADAAIRIFDLAYEMGFDLSWHIQQKVRYNSKRPQMHGGKKY
jgi:hypothetical protein